MDCMKNKYFLFVFVVFFLAFSSAVIFYDQGTDVVNSSGVTLENGSIEIYIYDASSGGNLVYNKNVSSGIINGSWNIKIEPDLEYGKLYYKDYVVEGDNLNFSGEDRIEFQSPSGLINNASFLNFSLWNNYALKNESVVFEENITTDAYGFFGWLGSLVNRVTGLFVQDINVNNSITLNGTTIENWDEVDTQKNASGYLYNDSATIYLNETMLNDTIILYAIYPMGEIYLSGNDRITQISTQGTWTLVNGTWQGNNVNMDFLNYSNGTLLYVGDEAMFFHLAHTLSVKSSSNNELMRAAIFKNGVLIQSSQVQQNLGAAGDIASTAIHSAVVLSNGDYLNSYIMNEDSANDFNVTYANLFAMGMRMWD